MKRLFISLFFASAIAQNCPSGGMFDSTLNTCLLAIADQQFYMAEMMCMQMKGHLVTINNAFQNTAVLQFVQRNFPGAAWIGLDRSGFWQDGTPEGYLNFAPNNPVNDLRCTLIDPNQGGRWVSTNCSQSNDFVCAFPQRTPQMCLSGWMLNLDNGFCYRKFTATPRPTFVQALSRCRQFGADLVSIQDQSENHFVGVLASSSLSRGDLNDNTWIGLRKINASVNPNPAFFQWTDGTPVNYVNFGAGEPNLANEQCIIIISSWNYFRLTDFKRWYDQDCSISHDNFICKMKAE